MPVTKSILHFEGAPTDARPIGVFDSGVGGLTVLVQLMKEFPDESFFYLGDSARLPYGTKTPETIARYVKQNIEFLAKKNCKAFVVACNTASSQVNYETYDTKPVYTVIVPGAELAIQKSKNKKIGLIATVATVKSQNYQNELIRLDPTVKIFSQACPLFVPLVEEQWIDDPLTNLIAFRYLNNLKDNDIDTLILGCTHYPLLTSAISKVVGPRVSLIDSGLALAVKMRERITNSKNSTLKNKTITFAFTDFSQTTQNFCLRILELAGLIFIDKPAFSIRFETANLE